MDSLKDLHLVTAALTVLGFRLESSEVGTMDSGAADYSNGTERVAVWKDRSQWFIGDTREVLEPMGCWRAYDDVTEFCEALVGYVGSRSA